MYEATYSDGWIYFIDERYDYFDTTPPPGTNENLFRMRPDGTELQECVKDVAYFRVVDDWIIYQSGWSLKAVKIDEWNNKITVSSAVSWNIRSWIIYETIFIFQHKKHTAVQDSIIQKCTALI